MLSFVGVGMCAYVCVCECGWVGGWMSFGEDVGVRNVDSISKSDLTIIWRKIAWLMVTKTKNYRYLSRDDRDRDQPRPSLSVSVHPYPGGGAALRKILFFKKTNYLLILIELHSLIISGYSESKSDRYLMKSIRSFQTSIPVLPSRGPDTKKTFFVFWKCYIHRSFEDHELVLTRYKFLIKKMSITKIAMRKAPIFRKISLFHVIML
jgi:hypothetical protein